MISVSHEAGVLIILLDRPEQRNAMSHDLVTAMIEAIEGIDASMGVVLIAGTHRGFCAGSDLAELAAMSCEAKGAFEAASGKLARLLQEIDRPVIAAVHGFAIGGGLTLAAACDIVVSAPGAKWGLPEVPIGLFPAWGLGAVVDRVGRPIARQLSWGIETLSGTEALRIGLADYVSDAPMAKARELAEALKALPTAQARAVKGYFSGDYRDMRGDERANALFMAALETDEGAATIKRFRRSASAS